MICEGHTRIVGRSEGGSGLWYDTPSGFRFQQRAEKDI